MAGYILGNISMMISRAHPSSMASDRSYDALLSSLSRRPSVKNEEKYYRDTIKKISTIDEFIKDYRILRYALKAHGLLDILPAKKFIRTLLESNLSDPKSIVNKTNNPKYIKFAQSFNFSPAPKRIQNNIQQTQLISQYIDSYQQEENSAFLKSMHFRQNAHKINSLADFFRDKDIQEYIFASFGIDPHKMNRTILKDIIVRGYRNPEEFSHVSQGSRLIKMSDYFRFEPDGSFPKGQNTLTHKQIENITTNYLSQATHFVPEKNISYNRAYYESNIGSIESMTDLTKDSTLFQMVKIACSINPNMSSSTFLNLIKTKDPSVNEIKKFFQYNDIHHTKLPGQPLQQKAFISKILDQYVTMVRKEKLESMNLSVENYQKDMTNIHSVDDLIKQKPTIPIKIHTAKPKTPLEFILHAYDININEMYASTLRNIFTSDPDDRNSYANKSHDQRFIKLNNAFNFDRKGKIGSMPMIQSILTIRDTFSNYASKKMDNYINNHKTQYISSLAKKKFNSDISAEIDYYIQHIENIRSLEDLMDNNRLINFILESKGIDPKKVTKNFLKDILLSDLKNPKSLANTHKDQRYKEIIRSFDFAAAGKKYSRDNGEIQNDLHINETVDLYKYQILEQEAEQKDHNTKLSLYFRRTAPHIKNIYDILADKDLFHVVSKTLNIPPHFSSLPQQKQADFLQKKIKIEDFKDSKKVQLFLHRFNMANTNLNPKTFILPLAYKETRDQDPPPLVIGNIPGTKKFSMSDLFF
ncbi:MAG: DUF1217 domain-containing protein [Candidatus Liberibacter ctenarytainae]|uniref:DUF1217 domain-containing protein n=1 Tax=Candidatus Liberibacter ctenarytainae TaxID=2020335 RepID=A0A937AC83_9HYPH|nr:DUF1217 domain-containing protein [Candidatus Liberibacter ctenarytainae]